MLRRRELSAVELTRAVLDRISDVDGRVRAYVTVTEHMAMATDALRGAAENVTVSSPVMTLLSDADGAAVQSGQDWLERIVNQVSAPVRWDACMRSIRRLEVVSIRTGATRARHARAAAVRPSGSARNRRRR